MLRREPTPHEKLAFVLQCRNLRMRPNPNAKNVRMNNRGEQVNREVDGRSHPSSNIPVDRRETNLAARESR